MTRLACGAEAQYAKLFFRDSARGSGGCNGLTITSGGQLITGANSYVGYANGNTREANNNMALISGANSQ